MDSKLKLDKKLKAIGKRICEERKRQGLTQAELAEKLQISVGHISNIELGKKAFRIDIFIKITEALNISADRLIGSNIPEVNSIYDAELTEFLNDCTPSEKEAYIEILKKMKGAFH